MVCSIRGMSIFNSQNIPSQTASQRDDKQQPRTRWWRWCCHVPLTVTVHGEMQESYVHCFYRTFQNGMNRWIGEDDRALTVAFMAVTAAVWTWIHILVVRFLKERSDSSTLVTMSRALLGHSSCKYSTVQYSTVQYSTVQYSTAQHSTAQYSTAQYSTVQHSTVQHSTVQYSTVQHSTVQYSTVQYSTAQYSTVQYSTV